MYAHTCFWAVSTPALVFDDVMSWSDGPSADKAHIYIGLYQDTTVERSTPARCCHSFGLSHSRRSSASSQASSSTLSSTDLPTSATLQVQEGDVLVLQCRMQCRDHLQPGGLLRIFDILALHVEVLV
ncbi:hypothetical protein DFH06DRAFT_1353405 [Mycena polygramma]|nr:hypothetical protein DFH06DRAFT_1353405 [Mycena polygramma]